MCDAQSLMAAGTSYLGGKADAISAEAQGIELKSAADFEAAQYDVMKVLASAQGSRDTASLRRDFAIKASGNLAAMAISGIAAGSFDSIGKGNKIDLEESIASIGRKVKLDKLSLGMQAREARRGGFAAMLKSRSEAKAALYGGMNRAIGIMVDAERSYQEANTGQGRLKWFMQSIKGA